MINSDTHAHLPSAEQILLARGVKPTPQRVVIAQYMMQTDSHPTADDVLVAVAEALPVALSRATVYNTLNTLKDAGVIREVLTEARSCSLRRKYFRPPSFCRRKNRQDYGYTSG